MIKIEEIKLRTLEDIKAVFNKWLYLKEDYTFIAPICAVLSNFLNADPDIFFIVTKSGGTKTEVIRAFGSEENEFVYPVSKFTPQTLISGQKIASKKKDKPKTKEEIVEARKCMDMAGRLENRILAIKDFTTILAMTPPDISLIFSDFREMTDGYLKKDFGNGVQVAYKMHSSVITGCTGAIESQHLAVTSTLGQRMIMFKPRNSLTKDESGELMDSALKNIQDKKNMRDEIFNTTYGYMQQIIKDENFIKMDINSFITKKASQKIKEATTFVTTARTFVRKNYHGDIEDVPEVESPTRMYSSICKLMSIHAYIHNRKKVNKKDVNFGLRVLHDNIPTKYIRILNLLLNTTFSTVQLGDMYKLPTTSMRRILYDLEALGIITHESFGEDDSNKYSKNVEYMWSYVYPKKRLKSTKVITINSKYLNEGD